MNQNKRKVFLVVDNLSVHKSQAVSEWVKTHCTRIRLFFLPKYSPDLNPDEYLNNDVKSNAVGHRRAKSKEEMKELHFLVSAQHSKTTKILWSITRPIMSKNYCIF